MSKKNNKTKKSTVCSCVCSHCGQESNATPSTNHLGCNGVLGKAVHPTLKGRLVFEQGKWLAIKSPAMMTFVTICKVINQKPIEKLKQTLIDNKLSLSISNVLEDVEKFFELLEKERSEKLRNAVGTGLSLPEEIHNADPIINSDNLDITKFIETETNKAA